MSEDNKKQVTLKGTEKVSGVQEKNIFLFIWIFFVYAKNMDLMR